MSLQTWPSHVFPISASQSTVYITPVAFFAPLPLHLTHQPLLKTISDCISVPSPLLISITTSQPQNTATSRPAKSNHLLPGPRTAAGALVSTYPSENPFSFLNSSNKYINVLWESENTPQSDLHPHPGPVNVTHEDMILYHPSGLSIPSPVCV